MTRYRGLPLITAVTLLLTGLLAASPAVSAPPGDEPRVTVARLAADPIVVRQAPSAVESPIPA